MLDARGIGQLMKGSRKVHEFTPEQLRNLTAIVWLYRGERERFVALVDDHIDCSLSAAHACLSGDEGEPLDDFLRALSALREKVAPFLDTLGEPLSASEILADALSTGHDPTGAVEAFRSPCRMRRNIATRGSAAAGRVPWIFTRKPSLPLPSKRAGSSPPSITRSSSPPAS